MMLGFMLGEEGESNEAEVEEDLPKYVISNQLRAAIIYQRSPMA